MSKPTYEEAVRDYGLLARQMASRYYLPGADREDVEQEAMFGLVKAVRDYRPERGEFGPFAALCIGRWLKTCVIRANRQKHRTLSESHRLAPDEGQAVDVIEDPRSSLIEDRELFRNVFAEMANLSELERRCVVGFACGLSYAELEEQTGRHLKSIDNAFQRGRRKLRAAA